MTTPRGHSGTLSVRHGPLGKEAAACRARADGGFVRLPADFYSLSPGTDALRPPQQTPVAGLTLAGDYTRQEYLGTMEGAVVSGRLAARAVRCALESTASDHPEVWMGEARVV